MNLGWPEILLIVFVVLILFGAKRIPEMMRAMGQGVKEFKKATRDITDEISAEPPTKPTTPQASQDKPEQKS
jgi:sec-independent protein translocase protein TatA